MRIQFRKSVSVPGGPRYHAGEVVETDPYHLTDGYAAMLVRRGFAVAACDRPAPPSPIETRALDRPPIDRMTKRPAVRK